MSRRPPRGVPIRRSDIEPVLHIHRHTKEVPVRHSDIEPVLHDQKTSKSGPHQTFRYWTRSARPVEFQKWFWIDGRYTDIIWISLWRHMFAGPFYDPFEGEAREKIQFRPREDREGHKCYLSTPGAVWLGVPVTVSVSGFLVPCMLDTGPRVSTVICSFFFINFEPWGL